MTYRELIELYKKGRLAEKQREEVEADIEKHQAISEYLCDNENFDEFAKDFEEEMPTEEASFIKVINRSIRRAFIKLGISVLLIALIAFSFVEFALPNIVSSFYYDPSLQIEDSINGKENQMSLDFAVFSEINYPGYYRQYVAVDDRGYGNYEIHIPQSISFNNQFTDVSGKIEKGKLTLYNNNLFRGIPVNDILWYDMADEIAAFEEKSLTEIKGKAAAADKEREEDVLNSLDENEKYLGIITLDRQMTYQQLQAFMEEEDIDDEYWCAVKVSADSPQIMWMRVNPSMSMTLKWDDEKYPNLGLWKDWGDQSSISDEEMNDETYMTTHFLSMMAYMEDQEKFCDMMETSKEAYKSAREYVEQNGLILYGFAKVMTKAEASAWSEQSQVYSIRMEKLV